MTSPTGNRRRVPTSRDKPVFLDESGRRWRYLRLLAIGVGMLSTMVAAVVVYELLTPPVPASFPMSAAPPATRT